VWCPVSVKAIKNNINKPRDGWQQGEKTRGEKYPYSIHTFFQGDQLKTMDTNQGNRIDLSVKGRLTLLQATSFLIVILMAGVSIAGLRERAVIYPTEELVQTFIPNDVVNLLIGLPVLLGAMWLAWRGKWMGSLLWMGALFFVFYNYTTYVFAMPLNGAFIASLFLMMLSAYTLIALVAMVDGKAVREKLTGGVHERLGGGVLAGLGLLFFLRTIGVLLNAINTGGTLAQTEMAVNIADFLIAPAWIIGGILLWRRRELGYVTGLGLLFQGSMLFIALIVFLLLQPLLTTAPFAVVDVIVIFLMGLICFIPFVLFLRGVMANTRPQVN
jgi:hypothetical protein